MEWLFAPIDASRAHDVGMHLSWHARAMVLAWGVCVPLGVMAARYFKVLPRQDWPNELDNRVWWWAHRGAQYTALVLMGIGLWLILGTSTSADSLTDMAWVHRLIGWAVIALAVNQYLSGWFRGSKGGPTDRSIRGDHYDMTPRRIRFERLHKTSGYSAITLAALAILTGMWQANAPIWMWLAVLGWWACLIIFIIAVAQHIRRVTTYEAIWGPASEHPGNQS